MLDPQKATFAEVYRFMAAWLLSRTGKKEGVLMVLALVRHVLANSVHSQSLWAILTCLRGADTPRELVMSPGKECTVGRIRTWLRGTQAWKIRGMDQGAYGVVYKTTWVPSVLSSITTISTDLDVDGTLLDQNTHFGHHLWGAMRHIESLIGAKTGERVPCLAEYVQASLDTDLNQENPSS